MHFGRTLKNSIYPPWSTKYIDYAKLKKLLREDSEKAGSSGEDNDEAEWTEQDEETFVQELVNVQLDKVNQFQNDMSKQLRDRISACESELELLASKEESKKDDPERKKKLEDILKELDSITKETNELEKYSRINFTGFLKAAKKHDRKGLKYRVRPLLQVRLASLPFNSEDYSPLLYRLSGMYSFVRQNLDEAGSEGRTSSFKSEALPSGHTYSSYRYWVHPENLMEVKTFILRRLPVLVYNPQTSKVVDGARSDPSITSLYLDNSKFDLYHQKVDRASTMSSVRFRWYGQLQEKPEIFVEKKTIGEETDENKEIRFKIKEKHVQAFLKEDYKMDKEIQKLHDRTGTDSSESKEMEQNVDEIQKFVLENKLSPVLRANYTRTAFQIPGDDRIRISLDTDMAFIREDSLDSERPCRDPNEWHRTDIDNAGMEFPFPEIRKGEISRFPFALLEIKVRDGGKKRSSEWVQDLMSSHLVKEAPRFSKFVNGVAQLFEDYVNSFPFWLSDLETDIRKDPEAAFQEEQEKVAKRNEDESAVGSYLGTSFFSPERKPSPSLKPSIGSPVGKSYIDKNISPRIQPLNQLASSRSFDHQIDSTIEEHDSDDDGVQATGESNVSALGFKSLFPSFPKSRGQSAELMPPPAGVQRPSYWIKDTGPVKVEAKVWLANQRTFIKWQHVAVLLASLSLGLYNAAGRGNNVARALAVVYTLFAVFAGVWGWWMYIKRSQMIQERSGKDFDNVVGPVVVCVGLTVALCLNFGFKYSAAMAERADILMCEIGNLTDMVMLVNQGN